MAGSVGACRLLLEHWTDRGWCGATGDEASDERRPRKEVVPAPTLQLPPRAPRPVPTAVRQGCLPFTLLPATPLFLPFPSCPGESPCPRPVLWHLRAGSTMVFSSCLVPSVTLCHGWNVPGPAERSAFPTQRPSCWGFGGSTARPVVVTAASRRPPGTCCETPGRCLCFPSEGRPFAPAPFALLGCL